VTPWAVPAQSDSLDSLQLIDGVVTSTCLTSMGWTREWARRYLRMPNYPDVAGPTVGDAP
jgi:putative pyruvate formate lyase activating enzyme